MHGIKLEPVIISGRQSVFGLPRSMTLQASLRRDYDLVPDRSSLIRFRGLLCFEDFRASFGPNPRRSEGRFVPR